MESKLVVLCVCALVAMSTPACRSTDETQGAALDAASPADRPSLAVPSVEDFELSGDGSHTAWQNADWTALSMREAEGLGYATRIKVVYSKTGLYVLMDGDDRKLTASLQNDFANLWTEDVFEVFLWTDERFPIYFEYEISPLGYELPILVPNLDDKFLGWRPWHYDGGRRTRKAVSVRGGEATSGAAIEGWRAEVFIPYQLLRPLTNVPTESGTRWRANFYRVDHDDERKTTWDWSRVGPDFHEFAGYGTLIFQ